MKSAQFRREREAAWRQLDALVARCDRGGIRSLSAEEVIGLSTLYQHAVGSLATARAISLDRNVITYLESLVARAHLCVYGFRSSPWSAVREFVLSDFPAALQRRRWYALAAAAMLLATIAAGAVAVARDPDRYYSFVPLDRAAGRTPGASTEALRRTLYEPGRGAVFELEGFATALLTHNAQVGLFCAALGAAGGLPIPVLVGATGLELGAMAELFRSRGLGAEFWAWILPHGVTEMLALVLCAAAGLATGFAFLFPGPTSRREATAAAGRDAGVLVVGALGLFMIAAVIEGIFRQRVTSLPARWIVAAMMTGLWVAYFGGLGRVRDRREP